MLILTRRSGEAINIGNDIEITVLGIKGNQVRLGITAPKEISVHRNEIFARIEAEKIQQALEKELEDKKATTTTGTPS